MTDVGVRRRNFAGGTRRAVERRDRECFHDDCDEPAEGCEIDHVVPWAAGGADHPSERAGGVRLPQPGAPPDTTAGTRAGDKAPP